MRFDDRLATVLARPVDRPADRVAQWRQLLDLLAQQAGDGEAEATSEAFDRLRTLRAEVPLAVRQEIARALAGRTIAAPLVAFLAADVPVVSGAILQQVRLEPAGWLSILPRLSPTGRGFLRHRRDLGPVIEAALASFGRTDMQIASDVGEGDGLPPPIDPDDGSTGKVRSVDQRLTLVHDTTDSDAATAASEDAPTPPVQALEHGVGEGQIRAIITRIARFRRDRDSGARGADTPLSGDAASFRFETGTGGVICWVDGVPRGPLIGETIAAPASGRYGVDAQAPGAFRRRAPFRDARLVVAGDSTASGEWRIAGVPVFAPADGRFRGYRCTARRPRAHERVVPANPAADAYSAGLDPDSLRQLVHELRTPLNAIGGFAEMIRRQMRGPASIAYRDRAQSIAEQAGRLLAAVDDLDVAARLETRRLDLQRASVDLGAMLGSICADYAPALFRRGALLECGVAPGLAPAIGDPAALRRMIARLIACCTALADERETIRVTLAASSSGLLELAVGHPRRLAGQAEQALLDPGYGPEGEAPDAPLLGLGFSLHLVRRLATAAGGTMIIEADRFVLRLPTAADPSRVSTGG